MAPGRGSRCEPQRLALPILVRLKLARILHVFQTNGRSNPTPLAQGSFAGPAAKAADRHRDRKVELASGHELASAHEAIGDAVKDLMQTLQAAGGRRLLKRHLLNCWAKEAVGDDFRGL